MVVETDGWHYHRTAGEQANDHRRDQAHATSGLTTVRFAEDQIRYAFSRDAGKKHQYHWGA
jgi:very-short-patch-repair endonuclease